MLLDLLLNAMQRGDVMNLVGLLDLNEATREGVTTLMQAAEMNHKELLLLLIDIGADMNLKDLQGNSALAYAARAGHVDAVKVLLNNGACVNFHIRTEVINLVALKGYTQILSLLLKASDAEPKRRLSFNFEARRGWDLSEAVMAGAKGGHMSVVSMLHDRGAIIRLKTRQAALEQAAGKGALNIVRFLLNSAPASTQQIDRCLPLAFPSMAKAREPDLGGPLVAAAASGHDLVALDLLGRGAPVNSINDSGNSALMAACRGSHASTVRLLVARGADVSYVSPTGASAFVFAVMGDQDSHFAALPFACLEIAMVLAYVGADIYTCNAWVSTSEGMVLGAMGVASSRVLLNVSSKYKRWMRRRAMLVFLHGCSLLRTDRVPFAEPQPAQPKKQSATRAVLHNQDLAYLVSRFL